MNERIRELEKQCQEYRSGFAGQEDWYTVFNKQKFAELIIKECCDVIMNSNDRYRREYFANIVQEHFGVE
jgi:hypothetical protein